MKAGLGSSGKCWHVTDLDRWAAGMRKIILGVKVHGMNGQQAFILPHLRGKRFILVIVSVVHVFHFGF